MTDENICKHCGGNINIRNPSGYCDHLYYPDNCEICKGMQDEPKLIRLKVDIMAFLLEYELKTGDENVTDWAVDELVKLVNKHR